MDNAVADDAVLFVKNEIFAMVSAFVDVCG